MQRLLSHAVTELGETRRSHKISKQGTYPSYFYPNEGGVYLPGLIITSTYIPQYLWCEKLVASRHIAMHWQSTHAVDKISFYISRLYIFSIIFIFILYLYFLLMQLTTYLSTRIFFILSLYFLWIIWQDIFLFILDLYRIFISSIHIQLIIWQYLCKRYQTLQFFSKKINLTCSKINSAEGRNPQRSMPGDSQRALEKVFKMYLSIIIIFSSKDPLLLHLQELTLSKSISMVLKKGLRSKRKIIITSYFILSRTSRFLFSIFDILFFASQLQKVKSQTSIGELVGWKERCLRGEYCFNFLVWFGLSSWKGR